MANFKIPKVITLPVTKAPSDTIWNMNTAQIDTEVAIVIARIYVAY